MENKEFKSNENNLSSNVITEPEDLIDEKSYKKLDKDLENIRKSKDKKYKKWVNARKIIDNFYNEHTYKLDLLYNRYIYLENELSSFHNIKIPISITVIFGLFTSISILFWQYMYKEFSKHLVDFNSIFENSLLQAQQYDTIKQAEIIDKLQILKQQMTASLIFKLSPSVIILIFYFLMFFIILFLNQKFMYKADKLKLDLYRYEADKIKNIIDKEEERIKLSELENQEPPTN